jgi:hypothetical protein
MGLKILKTPVRAPTADIVCERLIGTSAGMHGFHDSVERKAFAVAAFTS